MIAKLDMHDSHVQNNHMNVLMSLCEINSHPNKINDYNDLLPQMERMTCHTYL